MKNLLSNNWFIGIASGIISYIVIVCITKFLNEENINKANNEILDILKPYVIDIGLPEIDIVLSLIEAISRKYKIQPSKMYPIRILCDELIKEITESIYITSKKKNEYNQQLIQYKKEAEKIEIISNLEEIVKDDFKDRFIMQILIIILIAFLTVGALIFMEKYQIKKVKEMILLIFFLILVSVFLVLGIVIILKSLKEPKETWNQWQREKNN
ncbi:MULTISPECIES: hypothetical protein [Fusobacterium]|uniref:hypothetical protein n=1 Tax=Fusobacterium TaxID=848 RepID=UPI00044A4C08|nr:hypothetical protein [Fusobacterium sp. CM1]EUB41600.1 hypothetical protein HMPREF1498_1231 [Fusobacterium sp. CM1]